jgi:hypothetical protein
LGLEVYETVAICTITGSNHASFSVAKPKNTFTAVLRIMFFVSRVEESSYRSWMLYKQRTVDLSAAFSAFVKRVVQRTTCILKSKVAFWKTLHNLGAEHLQQQGK